MISIMRRPDGCHRREWTGLRYFVVTEERIGLNRLRISISYLAHFCGNGIFGRSRKPYRAIFLAGYNL